MIKKYLTRGLFALGAVATIAGCSKHLGSELKLDELIGRTPKPYVSDTLNQCGRQFYVESGNNELVFYEIGRRDFPAHAKFDSEGNPTEISSGAKYSSESLEEVTELRLVDIKSKSWRKGLENSIQEFTEEDVKHKIIKNKLMVDGKEYGILCSENLQSRDKYGEPVRGGYDVYIFDKDDFSGYTISDKGEIIVNLNKVSQLVPYNLNKLNGIRVSHKNKKSNKKKNNPPIEKEFIPTKDCKEKDIIVYPVRKGDTLPQVAKRLHLTPKYINDNLHKGRIGKKHNTLYDGDVLEICGSSCKR